MSILVFKGVPKGELQANMDTFFLTDLDPRAAIKGSRDPLGFQPIWTYFGRQVVSNLTTVTRSVRNFTTLLLGFYFAENAVAGADDEERQRLKSFLRFEQLAAYSRFAYGKTGSTSESPLGILRVRQRSREGSEGVTISEKGEHQILSSQTMYGIWGLYRVAATQSGLLVQDQDRLSPQALEFVESEYITRLKGAIGRSGQDILKFLKSDGAESFEPQGKDRRIGESLSSVMSATLTQTERSFYMKTLVCGDDVENSDSHIQRQLWRMIEEVNTSSGPMWNEEFDARELELVLERARAKGHDDLAKKLAEIQVLEPVLAAANRCFGFLLRRGDSSLDQAVEGVRKTWGTKLDHIVADDVSWLQPQIDAISRNGSGKRVSDLARSLSEGDYENVIKLALRQNADVMKERKGAPWVAIEQGTIKVKQVEGSGNLPSRDDLPYLWDNPYFINSLKSVGRTVTGNI